MDSIAGAMTLILDMLPEIIEVALAVIAVASAFTAVTPSPKDDSVLARLRAILEMLALNVGHARPGKPH